jgi:subtilisin family serine protease
MSPTPDDDLEETARRRTRDQYELLEEVHGDSIIIDTDDPADFGFICSSDHVLLPPAGSPGEDAVSRLVRYFNEDRQDEFEPVIEDQQPAQTRAGLSRRFILPARLNAAPDPTDLLRILEEIDNDIEVGFARPDHLVHICGKGLICPATEPKETDATGPWPAKFDDHPDAGAEVNVVVIDTGWYDPTLDPHFHAAALPWEWLSGVTGEKEHGGVHVAPTVSDVLRPYAGHGTFVAGVVRAVARRCRVHVLNLVVDHEVHGGGVFESDLVDRLYDALRDMIWLPEEDRPDDHVWPDLINMSAGCPTRLDLPARAFEDWGRDLESKKADLVLVAAAGNNATHAGFWPASFEWATGVGSLDRDGSVSNFSNFGGSVDVLAVGRGIVNAFPNGTYVCREADDKGKTRSFVDYLAKWSGTSFSAPLVTGLIAAKMSRQEGSRSATRARDDLLLQATVHRQVHGARTVPVLAPQLLI